MTRRGLELTIILLTASAAACASTDSQQSAEPIAAGDNDASPLFDKAESGLVIGEGLQATRFADLYFSGQPSPEDYAKLHEEGFRTVINLRGPDEYDEAQEASAVEALGMTYVVIPFAKDAELTDELADEVTAAVVHNREAGKLLVHCSTGNRTAVWLGGHFHKDHGLDKAEAMKMAELLGLSHPGAKAKLERYLADK